MKKFLAETLLFFSLLWIALPANSYGGKYLQLIEEQIKQLVIPKDQQNPNDEEKNAILFFTSDECAPCKQLERDVFLTKEFKDFINEHEIDFFVVNTTKNHKAAADWGVTATPAIRYIKYRSNAPAIILEQQVGYATKQVIFSLLKRLYLKPTNVD